MNAKVYFLAISALLLSLTAFAEIKIHDIQNATSATTADGKIAVFIEGVANGTYKIVLSGTASNTKDNVSNGVHTFDGLRKGAYTIKVTNKTNTLSGGGSSAACDKVFNVTIGVCSDNAITMTETKSPLVCDGAKDGFIDITAQGGTPPYKYAWNIGKTTEDVSNLEGDKKYKVTITDNQGCKLIKEIMVDGQKIELTINMVLGAKINSCIGKIDIEAKLTGTQNTGTISYQWSQTTPLIVQTPNKPEFSNFCGGTQSVVAISSMGCRLTRTFEVPFCTDTPLSFVVAENISPFNGPSGSGFALGFCNYDSDFSAKYSGGSLPYKYEILGENNSILFKGNLPEPNNYGIGTFNLPKPPFIPKKYTFKIKDQCGKVAETTFDCNCGDESSEVFNGYFFEFTKNQPCDVDLGNSWLGLGHTANHSYANGLNVDDFLDNGYITQTKTDDKFNRTYTITYPDGYRDKVTLINNQYKKFEKIIYNADAGYAGHTCPINSIGCKRIFVIDDRGCKFQYNRTISFGNLGLTEICAPRLDFIKDIPSIKDLSIPPHIQEIAAIHGGKKISVCLGAGICPGSTLNVSNDKVEALKYFPDRPDFPCLSGKISDCKNNVFAVFDGQEFFTKPANPDKTCNVPCACLFPAGQITRYPYSSNEVFVKTKKYFNFQICTDPVSEPANDDLEPDPNHDPNVCTKFNSPCGRKHLYIPQAGYNDCFFDVHCKTPDGAIGAMLYQNCPFKFGCCYDYDEMYAFDETKKDFFPPYVKLGTGQKDQVTFCRWAHPASITGDKARFHVLNVQIEGSCNNVKSCKDYTYAKVSSNSGNEFLNPQAQFKFLQMNEVYAEVYPNPFEQSIDFRLYHNKGKVLKIVLSDILGRLIQANDIDTVDGNIQFSIDVKDKLPKGMYIISLEGEDFRLQYPLVHQ